ncbi:MAG: ArsR family transcriptional regulator [Nitrososphaerota archaeon]|jgi:predicted transcriptional regulator|nr:ArsR family transcriptional regulator [Nitrososphaerota archaeon]MDG6947542.1 ArsR family transcriptional regulator [Nitrososphaerota archaeon]
MSMEEEELDTFLGVLENPIRRRIVKRLSQSPGYALQLAKELGLGQALVAKHLATMEQAGLVASSQEPSDSGPQRRTYSLAKSVSITLDLAPNLFIQKGMSFGSISGKRFSHEGTKIMAEASRVSGEEPGDVSIISGLLERIDRKLEELEEERAALLYIRNKAMGSATKAIDKVESRTKKRVIYRILEEHDMDVERLSQDLDLREAVVREILKEMRDFFE